MTQPEELKKNEKLVWSTGTGSEVWELFCKIVDGDLAGVRRTLEADPALVRCHHAYRTPIYFAVRENRVDIARHLLENGADPLSLAVNDSLIEIARDRGYAEMQALLEESLAKRQRASSRGNSVAAAIREYDVAKVRKLLDEDPELLHVGDDQSSQPIHWAVMTRQIGLFDELLARGADINAQRAEGARPIHLSNGDYGYRGWRDVPKEVTTTPAEVLAHVIARGAYVDICTAAHMGNVERVRELVDEDPGLANRVSSYVSYYLGSGSPLRNAAARGHLEVVRLLLERGADPNLPEEGMAPHGAALHAAVSEGHYEVAKLLLEHGAYPSAEMESSADCMSFAMMNSDERMIELLASYGSTRSMQIMGYYGDVRTAAAVLAANPALANDMTAFENAAREGNDAFVRLMLRYRPDLAKRLSGWGHTKALTEYLFAQGMNPSTPDWLGVTPLHTFARKGDVERAMLFIDHGADLHARDEDICSTPLGWAAKFGKRLMVEVLLRRGAKPELPDDPQWATPMAWAKRRGHADIVKMLEQYREHGKLPVQANREECEGVARDLVSAYESGDADAMQRLEKHFQTERKLRWEPLRKELKLRAREGEEFTLEDARKMVARAHGYKSWQAME